MTCPEFPCPPAGAVLQEAVLTTYDLDLNTLRTWIGPDGEAEKYIVFRGDGDFYDSPDFNPRPPVIKAAWPLSENGIAEAYFHAKVRILEYLCASGERIWHLVINSANIVPYDNLETALFFYGEDTGEEQPAAAPVRALFRHLLSFVTDDIPEAESLRARLNGLIRRLETVRFLPFAPDECGPGVSRPLQEAACTAGEISFIAPHCRDIPFLSETFGEILVISPFITPRRLRELAEHTTAGGRCVVFTNAGTAGSVLSADTPDVCWVLPRRDDPYVHAKLYLIRKNGMWELYCGSMNLTDYAVEHNTECMVRLSSPASVTGIESFLAAFCGRSEKEIAEELAQYGEEKILPDAHSPVFEEAAGITARTGYLRRLLDRRRYGEEESREVIAFLLSAQCPKDLKRLLTDPCSPSVPLRRTITVRNKQRDIYSLPLREMVLLGLLNHVLHRYDDLFSQNIFLHILNRKPSDVFAKIRNTPEFPELFLFRTDIHAFDPSMDADVLCTGIRRLFSFDEPLSAFLKRLVRRGTYRTEENGPVYTGGPAQMTGLPLGGFFENVYLQDFDSRMEQNAVFYVRCGDDILAGARTMEEIRALRETAEKAAAEKHLTLSESKSMILRPEEPFVFLGWTVSGNRIDFSETALQAIEETIRRKTEYMLIRCRKNGIPPVLRVPLLVRYAMRSTESSGLLSSFGIVTVPDGLKKIDRMITDAIRTAATGKTGNGRFRVSYKTLRMWGYRSLVNRYFRRVSRP